MELFQGQALSALSAFFRARANRQATVYVDKNAVRAAAAAEQRFWAPIQSLFSSGRTISLFRVLLHPAYRAALKAFIAHHPRVAVNGHYEPRRFWHSLFLSGLFFRGAREVVRAQTSSLPAGGIHDRWNAYWEKLIASRNPLKYVFPAGMGEEIAMTWGKELIPVKEAEDVQALRDIRKEILDEKGEWPGKEKGDAVVEALAAGRTKDVFACLLIRPMLGTIGYFLAHKIPKTETAEEHVEILEFGVLPPYRNKFERYAKRMVGLALYRLTQVLPAWTLVTAVNWSSSPRAQTILESAGFVADNPDSDRFEFRVPSPQEIHFRSEDRIPMQQYIGYLSYGALLGAICREILVPLAEELENNISPQEALENVFASDVVLQRIAQEKYLTLSERSNMIALLARYLFGREMDEERFVQELSLGGDREVFLLSHARNAFKILVNSALNEYGVPFAELVDRFRETNSRRSLYDSLIMQRAIDLYRSDPFDIGSGPRWSVADSSEDQKNIAVLNKWIYGLVEQTFREEEDLDFMSSLIRHDVTEETLEPNQVIFPADVPGENFFIIKEGRVRVEAPTFERTLTAGSYFGEISILRGKNTSAAVRTMEDPVTVLRFSRRGFQALYERYPAIRAALTKIIDERDAERQALQPKEQKRLAKLTEGERESWHILAFLFLLNLIDRHPRLKDMGITPRRILESDAILNVGLETKLGTEMPLADNVTTYLRRMGHRAIGFDLYARDGQEGVVRGDVQDMSAFADDQFDTLVSVGLFHEDYIGNDAELYRRAAEEFHRVLKDQGVVLLQTTDKNPAFIQALTTAGFQAFDLDEKSSWAGYLLVNNKKAPLTHPDTYRAAVGKLLEERLFGRTHLPDPGISFEELLRESFSPAMLSEKVRVWIQEEFAPTHEAHHFTTIPKAIAFAQSHGGTEEQRKQRVQAAIGIAIAHETSLEANIEAHANYNRQHRADGAALAHPFGDVPAPELTPEQIQAVFHEGVMGHLSADDAAILLAEVLSHVWTSPEMLMRFVEMICMARLSQRLAQEHSDEEIGVLAFSLESLPDHANQLFGFAMELLHHFRPEIIDNLGSFIYLEARRSASSAGASGTERWIYPFPGAEEGLTFFLDPDAWEDAAEVIYHAALQLVGRGTDNNEDILPALTRTADFLKDLLEDRAFERAHLAIAEALAIRLSRLKRDIQEQSAFEKILSPDSDPGNTGPINLDGLSGMGSLGVSAATLPWAWGITFMLVGGIVLWLQARGNRPDEKKSSALLEKAV